MAIAELPEALSRAGCTIKHAPRSPHDFLFPDEGEPVFVILFRCANRSFELRNRFNPLISSDTGLRTTWSTSDLVLKAK